MKFCLMVKLSTSFFFAFIFNLNTKTESTHSIVIFLTLFATITLLPFTLIWTNPLCRFTIMGVAILGTLGHYFMTIALSLAPYPLRNQ